ncbi:MAG: Ig-like domain-containing protein [Planctomycetota bacterium]
MKPIFCWILAVLTCPAITLAQLEESSQSRAATEKQELITIQVKITDSEGNPVDSATVEPWALQSALGHGTWPTKSAGGVKSKITTSNSDGVVEVEYPKFVHIDEQVKTTAITLSIDHPDYPYLSHHSVSLPLDEAPTAVLPDGSAILVQLKMNEETIVNDNVRAIWSSGRSWKKENGLSVVDDQWYRIPPLPEGTGEFMFVQFDKERVTHFSAMQEFKVGKNSSEIKSEVELLPAIRIQGKLSDNVPRPVINGHVKIQTISKASKLNDLVWFDWAEIQSDGSFVFDAWPAKTPFQLIALCDGFVASSGKPPKSIGQSGTGGNVLRAQVFQDPEDSISVEMTPMETCFIQVENAFGKKLENIEAGAFPNIFWWNGGSQIYGWPLARTSDYLLSKNTNGDLSTMPFSSVSDENGAISLDLPVGSVPISIGNDRFQLAATMGRRFRNLNVKRGQVNEFKFILQPKRLDILGDWEDLCGLVFG